VLVRSLLLIVAFLAWSVLTPTPTLAQAAPYRVAAGDTIEVYVWGEQRLQREMKVLPDGTFSFPLAGSITAAGRTLKEIEADIVERLQSQYRGQVPQVTASVRQVSGIQFFVLGKVKGPGRFSTELPTNVLQALSMAGGQTDFADVDNIIVLRPSGDKQTVLRVNLSRLLKGSPGQRDLERDTLPALQTGDVVVVP
jgi:polysaccharide biosynthesis/export protein